LSSSFDEAFNKAVSLTKASPAIVKLEASGIKNQEEANYYLGMLIKQYPDLVISSPKMEDNKTLTFNILSLLNEQDIDEKLKEFFTMFKSPFHISKPRVFYQSKEATPGPTDMEGKAVTWGDLGRIIPGLTKNPPEQRSGSLVNTNKFRDLSAGIASKTEKLYRDNISIADELKKLANLKEEEIISMEEFQKLKEATTKQYYRTLDIDT
jgi:hypothetical protein